jgi:hypothetical protein
MDHKAVVREKMTEKYLLEELDPQLRDEFEEHFFDCPECALDIRAASDFVTHSKTVLAESSEPASMHATAPVPQPMRGWFAWLRPAFAVPALALLLAVIGYQNLVTFPERVRAMHQLQLLPAAANVHLSTYGNNAEPLVIQAGDAFLLNVMGVIVPQGRGYAAYKVDLHNPAGGVESLPVSAPPGDTWRVYVPGAKRPSGAYKVTVYGVTAAGQNVEVGSGTFQLQIQQ